MKRPQIFLKRTLIVFQLLLLLTACGSHPPTVSTGATSVPSISTQKSTYTGNQIITFKVGNLLIRSSGIHCEIHQPLKLPSDGGNLVLATDRLKYDSAELQQMQAYAQAFYSNTTLPMLPNTLTWISGGDKLNNSMAGFTGCNGDLTITNVGSDSIQIQSMNIRLTSTPQKSEGKQYRLVNFCSILFRGTEGADCAPGRGGPGLLYYYYQLSPAEKGKVFSPQALDLLRGLLGYQLGINTTLSSNESTTIEVLFDSSQNETIYSILPELSLISSNIKQNVALSQLATTLSFTSRSLFSCYSLREDTFVQVSTFNNNNGDIYCI